MNFTNRKFTSILFLLTTAFTVVVARAAMSDELSSGEYAVVQSWSQEQDFRRPYYVHVPENSRNQKMPVFIFLHGNGGNAREAMRGFGRHRQTISSRFIMVFPQGYRESWNIVSERSKADDRGFIETIVGKLAAFENVDPNDFCIMGASNGAAMVNQLMIESSLPNVRNYISGVSPLNVWQYDGVSFKAKGEDNNYAHSVTPVAEKRLLNISGVKDNLVPYEGGLSRAIPAKGGKLAFVAAEESTFVWARHMGYEGKKLQKPTSVDGSLEFFSYLNGDIVHCKVTNEGHGAVHGIPEKVLLEFLGVVQDQDEQNAIAPAASAVPLREDGSESEVDEETQELDDRIDEAKREQRRHERFGILTEQKLKLLREIRKLHRTIIAADRDLDEAEDDDAQIERLEKTLHESEVQMEITQIRLEILERRMDLEELSFELPPEKNGLADNGLADNELADKADVLFKMLDAGNRLAERLSEALLDENEEEAEEAWGEFEQIERNYERRREILQLRFELLEAREEEDEEWIRELETELEERERDGASRRFPGTDEPAASAIPPKPDESALPIRLTRDEVKVAAKLDFHGEILPRLRSACFDCHQSGDASGDLNFEQLVTQSPFVINRAHWMNVIEQLKVRSMPPPDAEQPSDDDRRVILGWLTDRIENFDYKTVRRAGVVPAKRLTHDEYNNTVRDLVGMDLRPADRFPADLTATSGFENSANSLFIQPVALERYVGAAESIVQTAWPMVPTSKEHQSAWRRLLGEVRDLSSRERVQQVVKQFASRAYRRPVSKEELRSLMSYYDHRRGKGDSAEMAIREVLQVIFVSPNFLIRAESAPESPTKPMSLAAVDAGTRRQPPTPNANAIGAQVTKESVSDWELATRLSYFIWASMPDDELFGLALSGRLHQPAVLDQQVERMLEDAKSESLGNLFAAQWLGFADLDRVQRDQIDNPWATDSLVQAMNRESAMLFNSLVQRNASIDRLLDADYTFVNEELARHYGMSRVIGSEMQEVTLHDAPRRGVLGHASILATTSFPRRTSPVLRGNWVLSKLLGTPPPPPPPNVSEFDERVAENERLSPRQKLELHRANPHCYACHSQIDPLGFALEEFDWFGRYRPKRRGRPVDSVGKLPSGTQFRGLQGLSATLLKERGSDLAEQLTRKMLAYALGRQLEYYDEATVQELTSELEIEGRRLRKLIHAIVRSDTFLTKQL